MQSRARALVVAFDYVKPDAALLALFPPEAVGSHQHKVA
jgi:hypothetical protein